MILNVNYLKRILYFRSQVIRAPLARVAEAGTYKLDAIFFKLVAEVDMPHDTVVDRELLVEGVEIGCADEGIVEIEQPMRCRHGETAVRHHVGHHDDVAVPDLFKILPNSISKGLRQCRVVHRPACPYLILPCAAIEFTGRNLLPAEAGIGIGIVIPAAVSDDGPVVIQYERSADHALRVLPIEPVYIGT